MSKREHGKSGSGHLSKAAKRLIDVDLMDVSDESDESEPVLIPSLEASHEKRKGEDSDAELIQSSGASGQALIHSQSDIFEDSPVLLNQLEEELPSSDTFIENEPSVSIEPSIDLAMALNEIDDFSKAAEVVLKNERLKEEILKT